MTLLMLLALIVVPVLLARQNTKSEGLALARQRSEMVRQLESIDLDEGTVSRQIESIKKSWGSEDYPRWRR